MSAILEIPEVRRRVSRLSVGEYHRLDEFNDNGRYREHLQFVPADTLQCASVPAVRISVSNLFT